MRRWSECLRLSARVTRDPEFRGCCDLGSVANSHAASSTSSTSFVSRCLPPGALACRAAARNTALTALSREKLAGARSLSIKQRLRLIMAPRAGGSSSSFLSKVAHKASLVRSNGIATAGPGALPVRQRLAARSRVTNLGILLLLCFTSLSLLLNFSYWLHSGDPRGKSPMGWSGWETFFGYTPDSLTKSLPDPVKGAEGLNHLIVVVGHAIWAGTDFEGRASDDNWVLEEYQRGGSVKTFWKHIERGVQLADRDKNSLLVFSGGQTRPQSLQTEADSYFSLALSSGLDLPVHPGANFTLKAYSGRGAVVKSFLDNDQDGAGHADTNAIGAGAVNNAAVAARPGLEQVRMTTEAYAMDSFENLLFSVARFREYTGRYPDQITVVGYEMKKERFEELHVKAIRWPSRSYIRGHKRFAYVGIDDEGDNTEHYKLERTNAYSLFDKDMYGCHGKLLAKRKARNPTRRFHPYFSSAPEIAGLLNWCPPDQSGLQGIYPESLPWDPRVTDPLIINGRPNGSPGWGIFPDPRWLQIGRERD